MISQLSPKERLGYSVMGCLVAFGIAFMIGQKLRQPAKIELHQTSQPPIVIPRDDPKPIAAKGETSKPELKSVEKPSTEPPTTKRSAKNPTQVVNINTADASQLQTLPGIGPATASKIIEYRQSHGPYQDVDDLRIIKGFGQKRLDKIKKWLTIK